MNIESQLHWLSKLITFELLIATAILIIFICICYVKLSSKQDKILEDIKNFDDLHVKRIKNVKDLLRKILEKGQIIVQTQANVSDKK